MFDIVYVTWIVHVLAALVTAKAWYLYLSVRLTPTAPLRAAPLRARHPSYFAPH